MNKKIRNRGVLAAAAVSLGAAAVLGAFATGASAAPAASKSATASAKADDRQVEVEVLSPERRDNAGIAGKDWIVDLKLHFPGGDGSLARAGFSGSQLTGPGVHANAAPSPGAFGVGQDDRAPGLVVLTSTTTIASGPGTNLAGVFNVTGVTHRDAKETVIADTWLVGAAGFGVNVDSTLTVAVVADLNHDGVFNDAPNVVPDTNNDGRVDDKDLEKIGVAGKVVKVPFHINGAGI